jgi:hypothetical protein
MPLIVCMSFGFNFPNCVGLKVCRNFAGIKSLELRNHCLFIMILHLHACDNGILQRAFVCFIHTVCTLIRV